MKRAALAFCAVGTLCAAQIWSTHVHADAVRPTGYTAVLSGHTVTVCPTNSQARSCKDDPILCDGPVADAGSGDSEADGQAGSADSDTIRVPTGEDPPVQHDSGCSVRKPSRARGLAHSIHSAVLLLASAFLVRRRNPGSSTQNGCSGVTSSARTRARPRPPAQA